MRSESLTSPTCHVSNDELLSAVDGVDFGVVTGAKQSIAPGMEAAATGMKPVVSADMASTAVGAGTKNEK
ncbi:MAG: hypothetical protein ABSG53_04935 [Thermoguttaceae bacterium]|jgi:hypothetical protein